MQISPVNESGDGVNKQYTGKFQCKTLNADFIETMESICNSIAMAGLDPYSQLTGYLLTQNDRYITRTGNARDMIGTLECSQIQSYVKTYLEKT